MASLRRIVKNTGHRLRKLCNTAYYALSDKREILVMNAFVYQFLGKIPANNIGDDLNAVIIRGLSGKKVLSYNSFYHPGRQVENIMAIGSIIEWMGNSGSVVWGSGIKKTPLSEQELQDCRSIARICAVRGRKTRECLLAAGIGCPEVYGDPALLTPLLYRSAAKPVKGRVGLIPHYMDAGDDNVRRLLEELGDDGILIPVRGYRDWKDVIDLICSCEFIVSSSLHGLILSDAYNVPNQWVKFSDKISGGTFKYEDYYSAVGKEAQPLVVDGDTGIEDIVRKGMPYKEISFDCRPLLQACPFEITHPAVLDYLSGSQGSNIAE